MNKWLNQFLEKPDISDRFDSNMNMSGLSGHPRGIFERIFSPYGEHDFEERIAIAEVDGNQNSIQAHRSAYLDAFISLLSALAENDPQQDWLAQKVQTALATLEVQNFPTLN